MREHSELEAARVRNQVKKRTKCHEQVSNYQKTKKNIKILKIIKEDISDPTLHDNKQYKTVLKQIHSSFKKMKVSPIMKPS